MVKTLLHLEGLALLLLSVYFYGQTDYNWLLFLILLFSPDLFMLGYLINQKMGAIFYNLIHTYISAVALILAGLILSIDLALALGLILSAHIGLDRLCGFGLKYHTRFKDTHFQKV
ncbi:DUF4260 domain-containing protein [Amphibacillus sediminis]|uniref:DUF4260 domain-containing protein n=1 Tax=Amphibacillus sediminis TaxID=360185 RepID=UPI00082D839F|nr:DUF4260 domain-containing protein [Amphibacillus sediminis]